jgi:serine/threonine protein kinase
LKPDDGTDAAFLAAHFSRTEKLLKTFDSKKTKLMHLLSLSDYEFLNIVGVGQFSKLYLAGRNNHKGKKSERRYVIKVISKADFKDVNVQKQIDPIQEQKIMNSIRQYGNYFCEMHSSFMTKAHFFLVLEYEPVGDIQSLLEYFKKTLPETMAIGFIYEVCFALKHLHEMGIMHRDIKINNILVTRMGHAKISDFGESCFISDVPKSPDRSTSINTSSCSIDFRTSGDEKY